jgi:predicted flap endonuclease-1-like 5' DNA nuclease
MYVDHPTTDVAIASYRLYCTDCDRETVVRKAERFRDTNWKVTSLGQNKGTCPHCDPTTDVSELTDESEADEEPIDLQALDGIGQTAAENLTRAGYDTVEMIQRVKDRDLLEVDWVGETAVQSLKERANCLNSHPQDRW